VIRAAAEGNWQIERTQAGINNIEQNCVLNCKEFGQPRFAVIPDSETSLETIQIFVGGETRRSKAQLIGGWGVFGVVNDDQFPSRGGQGDIERARFRLWLA